MDCSSAGNSTQSKISLGPGYQVPFADQIRREADMLAGAVGLITEARQADDIIREGHADVVFLARVLLRDPYWPLNAAKELGADISWPKQYVRSKL